MRLYKVKLDADVEGNDSARRLKYAGTQSDAAAAKREMMAVHDAKRNHVEVEEVDVPTDKAGLLDYLNEHATGQGEAV